MTEKKGDYEVYIDKYTNAVNAMKLNKSLGLHSLILEFYKTFLLTLKILLKFLIWDPVKTLIVQSTNRCHIFII